MHEITEIGLDLRSLNLQDTLREKSPKLNILSRDKLAFCYYGNGVHLRFFDKFTPYLYYKGKKKSRGANLYGDSKHFR